MFSSFLHLSASDFCGRFDASLLCPQAQMELLVTGFSDVSTFQDENADFRDISEWPGVTHSPEGQITSIKWNFDVGEARTNWEYKQPVKEGGTIALSFIPASVTHFVSSSLKMLGTLETSLLPDALIHFDVSDNTLSGTFDMTKLPLELVQLFVNANALTGEIKLSALPPKLERIDISANSFEESLDFSAVVPPLMFFYAEKNRFRGGLDLSKRPHSLTRIWLYNNYLGGDFLHIDAVGLDRNGLKVDAGAFGEIKAVNGETMKITRGSSVLTVQGV